MTFEIKHAERLSRGELLLRSFFGWLYMFIPHGFVLIFVGLWDAILMFISFWAILFTGKNPKSFFDFQVGVIRWQVRLSTRIYNMEDGYPAFGINATDDAINIDIPYPERLSRGLLLVKLFFGFFYVLIPHGFILFFLTIGFTVCWFIGWWIILFTGKLPVGLHEFMTGYLRWETRVRIYIQNLTDTYPPFSLK